MEWIELGGYTLLLIGHMTTVGSGDSRDKGVYQNLTQLIIRQCVVKQIRTLNSMVPCQAIN